MHNAMTLQILFPLFNTVLALDNHYPGPAIATRVPLRGDPPNPEIRDVDFGWIQWYTAQQHRHQTRSLSGCDDSKLPRLILSNSQ
jgi:hypothetical protein